ncbi:MAG TPA: hypothetical protein VF266_18370 [Thermoanaerobaculia bacterium]
MARSYGVTFSAGDGHTYVMHAATFQRSASLAAALGVLGGATLVLSAAFFSPGKYILLPYALFVVATGVVLKSCRVTQYSARFAIGLASFLIASTALYVFISMSVSTTIPWHGHLWRFLFLLGLGAAIHAAVARVSD